MNPAKRRKIGHVFRELPLDIIGEILTFTERSVWRICRLVRHSWNLVALRDASVGVCVDRSRLLLLNTVRRARETLSYRDFCDAYREALHNVNKPLLTMELREFLQVQNAPQSAIADFRCARLYDDELSYDNPPTVIEGLVCEFHKTHAVILNSISYNDIAVIEDVRCQSYTHWFQILFVFPMPSHETIMLLKKFFVKKWNEYHKN